MSIRYQLHRAHCFGLAAALAFGLVACGGGEDIAPLPVAVATAPSITSQPAAATVVEGQAATFSVAVNGTAPFTYQWRRGASDIAGATASTYSVPVATLADSGTSFTVAVDNSAGSVRSSAAVLTVTGRPVAPLVSTQPAAAVVTTGGTAVFTIAVTGTPVPAVQWSLAGGGALVDGAGNGALSGAAISGSATSTLSLANIPLTASGQQFVAHVANATGSVDSDPAALTVNAVATVIRIDAAAGGTATSPDGRAKLVFPAGAFTADVTVTFTPIPAFALPTTEDFAPFQTTPGTFYRVDFAGGQLKPDVAVTVGLRRPSLMQAMHARRQDLPVPNGGGTSVSDCNGQDELLFNATRADGYETADLIPCGNDPSSRIDVGLGILAPTPPTTSFATPVGGADNDHLVSAIGHASGRIAYAYGTEVQTPTSFTQVYGLGIFSATGVPTKGVFANTTLIGFDGGGQVLALTRTCQLVTFGVRVSSLLGSTFRTVPVWSLQLPTEPRFGGCLTSAGRATPMPGGGWVVPMRNQLVWYDAAGVERRRSTIRFVGPQDSDAGITLTQLAADALGNVWGVGFLTTAGFGTCYVDARSNGLCPALIKVDPAGALLTQVVLGNELRGDRSPIALTVDAAGAAHVAITPLSPLAFGAQIIVRRFSPAGVPDWTATLPETWHVEPGAIAVDATGAVYIGTNDGTLGGSVTTPAFTFGRFVFKLTPAGANASFVRVVANGGAPPGSNENVAGMSVAAPGIVTYLGEVSGTGEGLNPRAVDLLITKFGL